MPIFCQIANRACGSMCAVHQITGTPHVPLFHCHVVSGLNMYREYVLPYHVSATRYEGKAGNDTPKPRNQMFFPIVIAAKVDSPESTHLQSAPLKLTDDSFCCAT